jgi:hypothetical protein
MKKLLILALAMIFIGGCIGNTLTRYDPVTGKKTLEITNLKSMVGTSTKALTMSVKDKDFTATLSIIDSNVYPSPESATAIFDGLTNLETGGVSGAVGNIGK